jgi:diadenosine tetraphosphate (Ap4A) HIT family hydrolase
MSFTLHPQLAADCVHIGDLPICAVLLNTQFKQFPWLIMVPRRTGCRDMTDVPPMDYPLIMDEVALVHDVLKAHTQAEKMNVATIGNMVPQLHIHIIARFSTDACWPKPVWGHAQPNLYSATEIKTKVAELHALLADVWREKPH